MNIIKFPLIKIEDAFGKAIYELPHGVVLGHDGENLTTEIQIYTDEILDNATYYLELSCVEGLQMEKHDGYLSRVIGAEALVTGDVDVQLTWTWFDVNDEGKEENKTQKSRVAKWRVLDSVKLSDSLEKAYPEILATLMANLSKTGIEMRYNDETRLVEWSYIGEEVDEWFPLFSADDVTEGASAYNIAVKNGFKGSEVEWLESLHGRDGKDGENGKDGYTPVKDVDYFDGKDGVDGKDGQDGLNGKDGYTPQKGVDYFDGENGKDGKDGKDGYTPQKDVDYFDGKDGKDGADGKDGEDYIITDADYQAIANLVLTQFVDGDNLTY